MEPRICEPVQLPLAKSVFCNGSGNLSIEGIRRLLLHLDAGPEGNTHVKIIDHREELLVYIAGAPYLRRDLNSPVASLKHTGVAAGQLHQLEESLRDDVRVEAKRCGQGDVGRILVHKEVEHHDSHKSSKSHCKFCLFHF